VNMKPEDEHREVPKEEAAVMPAGGLRKRRRDRDVDAERGQKPKEMTRGYCGARKRVTVGGGRITRCGREA
jgi:hypothetical protein